MNLLNGNVIIVLCFVLHGIWSGFAIAYGFDILVLWFCAIFLGDVRLDVSAVGWLDGLGKIVLLRLRF